MRILVIEDDATIAANVYDYLAGRGHAVDAAADGAAGLRLAEDSRFDAIVLDVGLPRMDGLELCRRLRGVLQVDAPVLMLTARDTLDDKLAGFAAGADDYLVKPFALKELEARLEALHKRKLGHVAASALRVDDMELDLRTQAVRCGERELRLTPKATRLLETLLRDPGRLFTRADLEAAVWGETLETSDALRTHLRVLRRAFVETCGHDPVENVHGMGYRLRRRVAP